jgi:membrane protease subunit HflK
MPWSNQNNSGGGWKGGSGGGPWGQGPSGGSNQPPDLEEMLKRSQDRMKQVMHGSGVPGPLIFLAAIVGAALLAYYAFFFRVNPDELGVVMRFGQFVRQEPPGLHMRLPYPIEEVRTPKVTQQNIISIGRGGSTTIGRGGTAGESSLMVTGDINVIDMKFDVFWRIKTDKVQDYLFNIQKPETTVREVAESVMREVVGQSNLQWLLTEGRQKTETAVMTHMQDTLDSYGAGIKIDQIQLKEVDPPPQVIASFRDVQAARTDRDRLQTEAQTVADQIVPRAKGEAERTLAQARGYKEQVINEAAGQAARFLSVLEEYKKAPEVTRRRMFLEMQERVMTGADKIILDNKGGSGVVPFLPLDQMQQRKKPEGGN